MAISAPPPKPTTSAAVNPIKLLGLTKRKGNEQKPRMSLIPNVVRKNLNNKTTNESKTSEESTTNNTATGPPKSNDDFRKLLTK